MASPLETFLALVGARPAAAATIPVPANPLAAPRVVADPRAMAMAGVGRAPNPLYRPAPVEGETPYTSGIIPWPANPGYTIGSRPGARAVPQSYEDFLSSTGQGIDLEPQRGRALLTPTTGPAPLPAPDDSLVGGMHDNGGPGASPYSVGDTGLGLPRGVPDSLYDPNNLPPPLSPELRRLLEQARTTGAGGPGDFPSSFPAAPAAPAAAPAVAAPAAPVLDIPAAGATPAVSPFADTMKRVQEGFGPAPKYDTPDAGMDPWMALLKGGLATMAAGSRPGATLGGSLAQGALTGVNEFDRRRAERNAALRAERQDQIKTAGAAAQIAGAQTQADQGAQRLSLEERRIVTDAKLKQADLNFRSQQLDAQLQNSALDRDNRVAVAQLNRDSAERVAEAQRGSTEALHMLSVQANRDAALTKQIDDTIAKGKTGPGGIKETYTPEEEAQIRQRIILDSPGTTLNEQFRTEQAASKFKARQDAVATPQALAETNRKLIAAGKQPITDPKIVIDRANKDFHDAIEAIKRDRIKVRT